MFAVILKIFEIVLAIIAIQWLFHLEVFILGRI